MNAIASVASSRSDPVSQFASRGNLNAPKRYTWVIWMRTSTTIAAAPKKCMPRTTDPSVASWLMN